ncbi:MAG: putative sulfate exporter family transporter [Nitrospirae bacterium]|nr:putative sulfate exporter family transporter [Nitrospirota bacterium]
MEEAKKPMGWKELYLKEDWWAIYLGLGIVFAAIAFFYSGIPFLRYLSVFPPTWTEPGKLINHFSSQIGWYGLQFAVWIIIFSISTKILGFKQSEYLPSFIFLYILSIITFIIGAYKPLNTYGFEAPLVALLLGLLISNIVKLPKWMDSGFRVEYYIKTGIVLLGATLPFTLIIWAGPVAFLQATIISVVTCLTIYFAATKIFGLDKRFGAVLGVGGAICGVSAAIAVGGAVKAKKEHVSVAIALVTVWAIIMIFFIPYSSKLLNLHPAPVGAWVGSSEFADAAGFAAAVAYGNMVGNEEPAIRAFTLMKVIGRDIWLGIWSFMFALIACLKWEKEESGGRPEIAEIWWRFPKFVLGFLVASIIITVIASGYSMTEYEKIVKPELISPIKSLRSWAFIFCFLSIGLTTRFRELAAAGKKPFWAFTSGVFVNVVLGFILSVLVLGSFWINKTATGF